MYQFCIAVLSHEFSRPSWQPLVSLYHKINRTLEVILGGGVVAGLVYLFYQYVPIFDHKRSAVIVILTGLLVLVAWFLGAVKRFHKDTLAEVHKAQEEMNRQLENSSKRIEFLTLLLGRSDAIYLLLDNRRWSDNDNSGLALAKSEIRYHEADIYNAFRDCLGSNEVDEYFQRLGAIPDTLPAQVERTNAHRNQLHRLLQSERAQRLEIASKGTGR